MRAIVSRAFPTSQRQGRTIDRDRDRRFSPVAARRASSARAGLQLGGGCLSFFVAYVTLNLLHAFGNDPSVVVALAPVPLFARVVASAICAVPAGLAWGLIISDRAAWVRRLPRLLAAAIALFVLTIVLFT